MNAPLIEVENLSVHVGGIPLVNNVSFELRRGQRLGLIGESGSGKTLTALAMIGLLADNLQATGSVRLDGRELLTLSDREMALERGNSISMIFQEPMTALNPVMRIGRQIAEPLRIHQGMSKGQALAVATELLERVGIDHPEQRARSFPHEMSGGQRQRAMIAMALACGPDLVIADEPTTALDVTVQAQVLEVLKDQVASGDTALLLITHDLPVVASVTDDVIVMRDGEIVDQGGTGPLFNTPSHPYTTSLVAAVPPMSRSVDVEPKPASEAPSGEPIVKLRDVYKTYRLRRTKLSGGRSTIQAVDGVDLDVYPGETFGIVGESGSGKSTLARLIMGLEKSDSGAIHVGPVDVTGSNLRPLRDIVQMIFQDPMGSLDPRLKVSDLVAEPMRALHYEGNHEERVASLLDAVALPAAAIDRYPHEFSGGQRQRIAIARALAPGPRLLVADEPVSALDMSVQTLTLDLLRDLKEQFDLTMVFISHDLSVVHEICERVVVLEHGNVVERGDVGQVFGEPQEPYTQRLVDAIPRLSQAAP